MALFYYVAPVRGNIGVFPMQKLYFYGLRFANMNIEIVLHKCSTSKLKLMLLTYNKKHNDKNVRTTVS